MGLSIVSAFIARRAGFLLIACVGILITVKVVFWGYHVDTVLPEKGYDVGINLVVEDAKGTGVLESYLPATNAYQQISLASYSGPLSFSLVEEEEGLTGYWRSGGRQGSLELQYSFHARIDGVNYELPPGVMRSDRIPGYALPDYFQERHFELETLYKKYIPETDSLLPVLEALYTTARLQTPAFFGSDSISAEVKSFYENKNQVFLALADHANIPGRLVNGLDVAQRAGAAPHQWVELFINNLWIPFDAQNGHFASRPDHYLFLYFGESPLISYSQDLAVQFRYRAEERFVSKQFLASAAAATSPILNPFQFWLGYLKTGLSVVSLFILLLLPVAATVVVFFRNIVGLETYGIFLPALIATSGLHAGLLPTILGYVLVTLLLAVLHLFLANKGLLYLPKLSFMLLAVVVMLMGISYLGIQMGWEGFVSLAFLPLVILASSAENLSKHLEEDGVLKAAKVMGVTVAIISICFLVVDMTATQWLFVSFPELLLVVGVVNLWMGRWVGLRISEYGRFRWLMSRETGMKRLIQFHRDVLGINHRNGVVIHEANKRNDYVLANDKDLAKQLLTSCHIPVPPTLCTFAEIRELKEKWPQLQHRQEFVVKPANGQKGNNILVLSKKEGHWVTPGGSLYDKALLQKHIADIIYGSHSNGRPDKALIEYRVHTHPFFLHLYSSGLPDLRVITHKGKIIQAMLRVPTSLSDGKANLHQGAVGIGIELNSGRLQKGFYEDRYIDAHPDSGVAFVGLQVPDWLGILAISHQIARLVPLQYLGIDIVIDQERGPLVLEINARPGLQIQNINKKGIRSLLKEEVYAERNV